MLEQFMEDISPSLARAAFAGTSFEPERRGETVRREYAQDLENAWDFFNRQAEIGGTQEYLTESFEKYRKGCKARFCAYLSSSSRGFSAFIAGPSKFPAARMNKRADMTQKRLQEYVEYRGKERASIARLLRPDLAPILSSDTDADDKLRAKIAAAQKRQDMMKSANAAIRKEKKNGENAQVAALMAMGIARSVAQELIKPDFCGRVGFADYELINNNANIKRMQARLETVTEQKAAEFTQVRGNNGIMLEDDPPANRVRLIFPGKPDEETRNRLKSRGFRWSPSAGAWQAYRNPNSLSFANEFIK